MSVIPFKRNLRKRRSENTYEAIKYQLEHIFEKQGLRNFTLGDSRGLILAGAGHEEECEVLAAYAPLLAKTVAKSRRETIMEKMRGFVPDVSDETIDVRSFQVDGETLHLCVLGEVGTTKQADLYRATTGIRRILDTTQMAAA